MLPPEPGGAAARVPCVAARGALSVPASRLTGEQPSNKLGRMPKDRNDPLDHPTDLRFRSGNHRPRPTLGTNRHRVGGHGRRRGAPEPELDRRSGRRDPGRRGRRSRHLHAQARERGQDYASGYREIRSALTDAWAAGHVVVAFNAAYDLTVLDAEGRRLGWPPLSGYGLVVDPYVIDREMDRDRRGKRTLGALCEHYGVVLAAAHEAESDALAAAELARLLPRRFPHLAALDDVMTSQAAWHAERQRDLVEYLRSEGRDASDVDGRWPIRGAA